MKTTLLIVFFLLGLGIGIVKAQNALTTDSVFTSSDGGKTVTLSGINTYKYDGNCRDTDAQTINTNAFLGQPYSYKSLYDYYPDGSLYHEVQQTQQTAADSFVNYQQLIYTYTPAKQIATFQYGLWVVDHYVPSVFDSTAYNAAGEIVYEQTNYWNVSKQSFVNTYLTLNTYDTAGKKIDYLSQQWDTTSMKWENSYEQKYIYDANEYLVSDTTKQVDYQDTILLVNHYDTYYNNNRGLPDSSYLVFSGNTDSSRKYNTYYPNSNLIQQTTNYNYEFGKTLTGDTIYISIGRDTYIHDSLNNVHTDSTISEQTLFPGGPLVVIFISVMQKTYDTANKQLAQLIEYQVSPNEIDPIRNYYQINYTYAPCQSVLPVTLLNFTAAQKNADAVLQWQTVTETNMASFGIERSVDGVHFSAVGQVMAAGNAAAGKTYGFTDVNITLLSSSKIYYRLAEKDRDGRVVYSNVAQLTIAGGKWSVSVSPNPVGNAIVVRSPVSIASAVISVTNLSGQRLYSTRQPIAAGGAVTIDASAFAKGVYVVSVVWNGNKQVLKIVK